MNDKLKNLTGKNPSYFEPVAYALINDGDEELFSQLVDCDEFLFDFVKQNVANRLERVCNETNFLNLLKFLKYYSPSYEDFIISVLTKYADDRLIDEMLNLFNHGLVNEKIYCAKFFSKVKHPLAVEILRQNAYSENSYLSSNCGLALGLLKDKVSYEESLNKLASNDDFEILDGVKFLVSYGAIEAIPEILKAMKKSSFCENIAGEIPYLCDLFTLYSKSKLDTLFVLNSIINGLGEILSLSQVFDFKLYDFIEMLISSNVTSELAVVLINAVDKFETLTENDEYLFDETKETKQEILDIKNLLSKINLGILYQLIDNELKDDSLFIYTALEYTENEEKVRSLLTCNNQTVILKALETLKQIDSISDSDRKIALAAVTNENIKNVIVAI